jgi:hypothetical protein
MYKTKVLTCTVVQEDGKLPWMRLSFRDGTIEGNRSEIREMELPPVDDATDMIMWVQMILARACDAA